MKNGHNNRRNACQEEKFKQNNIKKLFFFFTLSYQIHLVGLNPTLQDVANFFCNKAYWDKMVLLKTPSLELPTSSKLPSSLKCLLEFASFKACKIGFFKFVVDHLDEFHKLKWQQSSYKCRCRVMKQEVARWLMTWN